MFAQAMTRTNSWVFPLILWLYEKYAWENCDTHLMHFGKEIMTLSSAFSSVMVTKEWWPWWHHQGCSWREEDRITVSVALQLQLGQRWREPLCGPSLSRQGNVKWGQRVCLWAHIDLGSNSSPVIYYCVTLSKFFIFLVLIFFICKIGCCATSSPNSSEVFTEITYVQCLHTDQR